jgi:hypothetical protein
MDAGLELDMNCNSCAKPAKGTFAARDVQEMQTVIADWWIGVDGC